MSPLRNPPGNPPLAPVHPLSEWETMGDLGTKGTIHCSADWAGVSGCPARTVRPMPRPRISASRGLALSRMGEGTRGAALLTQIQGSPSPSPLSQEEELHSALIFRSRIREGRYQRQRPCQWCGWRPAPELHVVWRHCPAFPLQPRREPEPMSLWSAVNLGPWV